MFFKSPGEMQPILGHVFDTILKNYQDVDLRDRTYYYYNLMKKDINLAGYIICGEPTVVDYFYSDFDEEYIDQIYSQFNSLSVVYRKPEEKFTKYTGLEDDEEKKEQEETKEEQPNNKPVENINETPAVESNIVSLNELQAQESSITIQPVNENSLIMPYTMDENEYQTLWEKYSTYVNPTYKMIADEVEVSEYVGYLETKGIFTKAFGTENGVTTMFLFSCEKEHNVIFLAKLVLNTTTLKIEYELKSVNEQCANEYNSYLYENVSPLIDQ